MVNGAPAPVSSQVSVSATADSRGFQGAIPRSPEFLRSPCHDSIPIADKSHRPRGSVQLIFSVIRRCVVGKNRVSLPYDGKDALRFVLSRGWSWAFLVAFGAIFRTAFRN